MSEYRSAVAYTGICDPCGRRRWEHLQPEQAQQQSFTVRCHHCRALVTVSRH
jgi:hypothetical protein